MKFDNKVAIVTGGANGIGFAVTRNLIAKGAQVAVFDIDDAAMDSFRNSLEDKNKYIGLNVDISNKEEVEKSVKEVVKSYNSIDILVNNAGGSYALTRGSERIKKTSLKKLETTTEEFWDETNNVNLKGYFLCCQVIVPYMKENRGGKIVNLSSQAARAGSRLGGTAYAAAKAGVIGLTKQLAFELGEFGINVNAIAPGVILTERVNHILTVRKSDEELEDLWKMIPLGRGGTQEELAAAIVFLCSDAASYITGVTLDVNGGFYVA